MCAYMWVYAQCMGDADNNHRRLHLYEQEIKQRTITAFLNTLISVLLFFMANYTQVYFRNVFN